MYLRLFAILGFLFGAHLFLYYSAVRFLPITGARLKKALFAALSFLSISFMVSAFLIRLDMNPLTRGFYLFSAFWSGLMINLLMAAALCWLAAPAAWVAGRTSLRSVSRAFFIAAFLFSAYGVWNAFHPRIKNVEVDIPGLPPAWLDKTIVQISDVHLGAVYTEKYFRSIARTINSLRPDVIFITGDLFDSISRVDLTTFAGALNELQARDGIFYVNGNHENYIGVNAVMSALAMTKIRVLRDEAIRIEGVQILGVDYPDFGAYRDVKKVILERKGFKKGMPTILLYHTPTSIEQRPGTVSEDRTRTYWRPEVDFTGARELGVNLQLSGHTHRGQIIPFVYLAGYLYRGYDYGLHREGGFSIYTTSGLGTVGPPMRTGNTPEIVVIRLTRPLKAGTVEKKKGPPFP